MFVFAATLRKVRLQLAELEGKYLGTLTYLQGVQNAHIAALQERNKLFRELQEARRAQLHTINAAPQFDDADLRRLLQLCHPDKHGNSDLSLAMTTKLNQARKP